MLFRLLALSVFIFNSKITQGQLHEDDPCDLADGRKGVCIPIGACDYANELQQSGLSPITCGFKGKKLMVCCPTQGLRARKKCSEYHNFAYDIDEPIFVAVAVGGEDSLAKEFPHMAALGFRRNNDIEWRCGGTLISYEWVLTAAHCLFHRELGYVAKVRLGDLNLDLTTDDADPQEFDVSKIIRHPNYKAPLRYHDIALIKLSRPVKVTEYVKPACLDTRKNLNDTLAIATGWGLLGFAGDRSPHLQKVRIDFFTHDECQKSYSESSARTLRQGIVHETQICAGGRDVIKDTCQGDSGGPLLVKNDKYVFKYINVAGVTTFGKSCGIPNVPAIYTRVSYYVPWIEDIVWPK